VGAVAALVALTKYCKAHTDPTLADATSELDGNQSSDNASASSMGRGQVG
jgi:hypothetical protein